MTNLKGGAGTSSRVNRRGAAYAWFFATRPSSFVAAAMPTLASLALAWRDLDGGAFLIAPAICCFFFAVFGQAAANLINDFSDYRTGANREIRERNERDGWVDRRSLLFVGLALLAVAVLFGLATLPYGGKTIFYAGLVFSAISLLYSVGPFPLSERGLGDLAVFTTFGLGSASFTYFLQTKSFSCDALALGVVFGLAINNILVANNYADCEQDRAIHKYTTIVLFGERFGRSLYLVSGIVAVVTLASFYTARGSWGVFAVLSLVAYWLSLYRAYLSFSREDFSKELGLDQAGTSVVILGVLVPLAILF